MYDLIIFDFDGTLVDSLPGIVSVMEEVVAQYDLPKDITQKWQKLIGLPLIKQMEIVLPDFDEKFWLQMATRYREIYDAKFIEICPPFKDTIKTLEYLKNSDILITIASSKRRPIIEDVLKHYKIYDYFDTVLGVDDVKNHKPHPEPVEITLQKLKIDKKKALVVGDSTYDLEMAHNANVDSIGVTTGVHSYDQLQILSPKFVANNLDNIVDFINPK